MSDRTAFPGGCHCGNIHVVLESARPLEELSTRACGCTFCRRHGAVSVTDPGGRVELAVSDPAELSRYRFALRTADFLVCRRCGVYAAAYFAEPDGAWAVLNGLVLDGRDRLRAPEAVSYDGETAAERMARRRTRWTPARLVVSGEEARS